MKDVKIMEKNENNGGLEKTISIGKWGVMKKHF